MSIYMLYGKLGLEIYQKNNETFEILEKYVELKKYNVNQVIFHLGEDIDDIINSLSFR